MAARSPAPAALRLWLLSSACLGILACGGTGEMAGPDGSDDSAGSGGSAPHAGAGSGGAVGSGGVSGSGGMVGTGGAAPSSSGGATASGGTTGSGGATSTGGKPAGSGGASSSGGRSASGGNPATGGAPATGGSPGTNGGGPGGGRSGAGGRGGASAMPGSGGAGGTTSCPMTGHVTYTLTKLSSPTADEQAAYARITAAMDMAVTYYNCYTSITKADTVTYVPSVQTADGSTNGSIRFGSTDSMNYITAMHEISHTVGIGSSQFAAMVKDGIFTGTAATTQLRAITGNAQDQVHGDTQHFWPNGLNYTSEVKSVPSDLINHCLMVTAIRKDLGM